MGKKIFTAVSGLIVLLMLISLIPQESQARAGGGRSMGSRGSRSFATPGAPPSSPYRQGASQQTARPSSPPPYQAPQPAGGGFFRNMGGGILGGIAGGLLGGMLFRSLGLGGMGGAGGGGMGIFAILLLGGIAYLIYRFIKGKREATPARQNVYPLDDYREPSRYQAASQTPISPADDLATGLAQIRQVDPSFDEQRFTDQVMDIFFKIQSAWMNRDLLPAGALLTSEIRRTLQDDIDRLLKNKQVNHLENIAVRKVEIVEAWQESGQDYITALLYANLLDYTTDDTTGQIVEGSKTEPVKFEEYWTVTRPAGSKQWQLSAIGQKQG